MSSELLVGIYGILAMIGLLIFGMPVGLSMAVVGFVGFAHLAGWQSALAILGSYPFDYSANYALSIIPLFILMGQFAYYSGMSRDMFYSAHQWRGHLPGGLGMATIAGCAGFAAVSGSSLATSATMGTVALPEMLKYKYHHRLAAGSIAAGGTLGILIPPSTGFVVYGLITEQSIGKLFLAGILPGLLLTVLFMVSIYIQTRLKPELGPSVPNVPTREKMRSLAGAWGITALFIVVIGGIYTGVFTPTEAAAVGAFGTLLFALCKGKAKGRTIKESLLYSIQTTAMIFLILIGAHIFTPFLAISNLPTVLVGLVTEHNLSPYTVLIGFVVLLIILGCFLEGLAMIVMTVPLVFPAITALGFDPIYFGVILVIVLEMGLITPPVGLNVFVLKGVAPDITLKDAFIGIFPFWLAMLVCLVILLLFPQIAMLIPNTL